MKNLLAVLALCLTFIPPTQAQENNNVDYTIDITWREVSRPDSGPNHYSEFVNGERSEGHLRIRKEVTESGMTASDLARSDQEKKLQFIPGYVSGKEESFAGRLNGVVSSYEFTSGGKSMAGRIYYLKADARTFYVLHFTGARDKLQRIRNQTDAIARSFQLK
jgi:hypothetical protein